MKQFNAIAGILITLGLMSAQSALAWENLVNCDNGAAVVDRQVAPGGYSIYQLVLRGNVATWALNNEGVPASFENQQGELIFTDTTGFSDALGQDLMSVHFGPVNQLTDIRLSTYERSLAVAAPGTNGEKYYFNSCSISPQ